MRLKNSVLDRLMQLKNRSRMMGEDILAAKKFYADRASRGEITICMATHPPKKDLWKNAYRDLRAQCDRFILVLGGYGEIPKDFAEGSLGRDIADGKLRIEIAGKNGLPEDKGCQNKFAFYGDFPGYYCTFDDDIRFSENCVHQLIRKYEMFGGKAITSFHGEKYAVKNGKIVSCYDRRKLTRFKYDLWHGDEPVHLAGCGCMAVRPADFGFGKDMFFDRPKNIGDDEILALYAQRNGVPLVSVDNTHCVMYSQDYDRKIGLYYRHKLENHKFKVLNSYAEWHLAPMPQKILDKPEIP